MHALSATFRSSYLILPEKKKKKSITFNKRDYIGKAYFNL